MCGLTLKLPTPVLLRHFCDIILRVQGKYSSQKAIIKSPFWQKLSVNRVSFLVALVKMNYALDNYSLFLQNIMSGRTIAA